MRKIVTSILACIVMSISFIAHAGSIQEDTKKKDTLERIEPLLLEVIDQKSDALLNGMHDQLQDEFYMQIDDIKWNITNAFWTVEYMVPGSDFFDEEYIAILQQVKVEIQDLKEIFSEIKKIKKSWENPFDISEEEKEFTASEVLKYQNVLVDYIHDQVLLFEKGKIDTVEGSFEMETNDFELDINLDTYKSWMSYITGEQKVHLIAEMDFNPFDDSMQRTQMMIDIEVVITDDYIYFTLADMEVLLNNVESTKVFLDDIGSEVIGKTFRMKNDSTGSTQELITNLKQVLNILRVDSLLVPYKKHKENLILDVNFDTVEKIFAVYDTELTEDDKAAIHHVFMVETMFCLEETTQGSMLYLVEGHHSDTDIKIGFERKGKMYDFFGHIKDEFGTHLHWFMNKSEANIVMETYVFDFVLDWSGGFLVAKLSTKEGDIVIQGDATDTKLDLVIFFDEEQIGNLNTRSTNNSEDLDFDLLLEDFEDEYIYINMSLDSTFEELQTQIEKPALYEDLDTDTIDTNFEEFFELTF